VLLNLKEKGWLRELGEKRSNADLGSNLAGPGRDAVKKVKPRSIWG